MFHSFINQRMACMKNVSAKSQMEIVLLSMNSLKIPCIYENSIESTHLFFGLSLPFILLHIYKIKLDLFVFQPICHSLCQSNSCQEVFHSRPLQ